MARALSRKKTAIEDAADVTAEPLSGKAEQIVAAARRIFLEQGYGASSMDAIAQAAGVSKATVYAHFAGKEALFAAIIRSECRMRSSALLSSEIEALPIATALERIGRNFLDLVLSPQAVAVHRVVIAESGRFPELGRVFYDSGPRMLLGHLSAFLRRADERGTLAIPDPDIAAEQFLSMLKGEVHLRRILGLLQHAEPAVVDRVVTGAVSLLLRAYAPAR